MPASSPSPASTDRILFLTGRLAEPLVRRVVDEINAAGRIDGTVEVLGISVAALLHVDWIARKLSLDRQFDRGIVPGWCQGDLQKLTDQFGFPFERGPKDIHELPHHLGQGSRTPPDLSAYDIEILAEINHAPRLSRDELRRAAQQLREEGADVIDVGCIPGESWRDVGDAVRMLREAGLRVSIDSFDRHEVEAAVEAGAELVLSGNSSNRDWLAELPVEAVIIPDHPRDLSTMWETVDVFRDLQRPHRIDPIVEPIGCGFAQSLARYFAARRHDEAIPMMMGVGNLTEMTEVDSAGVNFLLAGICQEVGIHSILTTQVINWCRSAVREFDIARRLVKYAVEHQTVPKHVDSRLVMLRDSRLTELGADELTQLASQLTDPNFRIFVEAGAIHIMNRDGYWTGTDAYELFDDIVAESRPLDSSHAFYLGYELSKAITALTLGKQYRQDEALSWGMLTIPEPSAHERRRQQRTDG